MIPLTEVAAARSQIRSHVRTTPVTLDDRLGLWLKWENRQATGSFKLRGALNKVFSLSEEQVAIGLFACSAGNHGLGLALAAQTRGASVTVFASEHASPLKLERMRKLGAEVVLVAGDYGEAETAAIRSAAAAGTVFVSPYNDPLVMAGAATVASELIEHETPDAVLVPAGGGGLLAGVGSLLKQIDSRTRVIAVQSENSAYLHAAFHGQDMRKVIERPSIADGLAGPVEPGSQTVPLMLEVTDDFLLVSEEEIAQAVAYAYRTHGETIEASAAVGLAAVLAGKFRPEGVVQAIVTGANIDPERHRALIGSPRNS
jgi:threonine dehydratase